MKDTHFPSLKEKGSGIVMFLWKNACVAMCFVEKCFCESILAPPCGKVAVERSDVPSLRDDCYELVL